MKRTVLTIKTYDYNNKKAFEKDVEKMAEKGWRLITDDRFGQAFEPFEIVNDDEWHFTASFVKSDMC